MSKKETFWNYLTVKHPKLLEDPHFTARGLKQFFDAIYNNAYDHGFYAATELQKTQNQGSSIFEEFFGAKK